ncbi:hypothetical protein [Nostoc sp. NMS9]|uniref:hypothetical protein n=1 Tax=Nostoc sp. NMS9 TaxID=2815393 RepID=UPI0025E553C3|nr:hypothetical protein [Nostoc sp. NMS9]MBN3941873.1 hypothetical protein [Nostoc sp. NMS9]
MPTQKTRNYSRYVNDGKEEDAMNRVSTRVDRKNDHISILFTISVLLGAIAFPGLRKDQMQ